MSDTPSYASLPGITTLLDAISAPAVLMDLDYQVLAANEAYRRQFASDTPLIGRRCYEVSHGYHLPCDQMGETCPLRQCLEQGHRQRILHIHNTARGREHVDVELNPVRDSDGNIEFFVEIMHPAVRVDEPGSQRMIGFSPAYTRMLELLNRAAPSDISVLLQGESGTGKELAAQYLHNHSQRAQKTFVTLECTGLSENLFESELFGHEKGAFTGAIHRKPGLVEAARGGTLFLDEVGDIPLDMQVKLLRLLESRSFRPVGSVTVKQADFRLVCATHRNLAAMVAEGTFRRDLYYRISPFPIALPTLAQRGDDVLLLAEHLLASLRGERTLGFSNAARDWLRRQNFPGNIRELRNHIERAILLCDHDRIEPDHLRPESLVAATLDTATPDTATRPHSQPPEVTISQQIIPLATVEDRYLEAVTAHHTGDKTELARALGVSERTLYRKLKRLNHSTNR